MSRNERGVTFEKIQIFMIWIISEQDRQFQLDFKFRRVEWNRCWSGKTISFTHYVCVFVVLGVQRVMRMRHMIISSLYNIIS